METQADLDTGKRFVNPLIISFCHMNVISLCKSDTSEPLLIKIIIGRCVYCLDDEHLAIQSM